MSERLPPIPTPPAQLWRNLRLQYFPVVIFLLGLCAAAFIWTRWVAPPTLIGEAEAIRTELRSSHAGRIIELNVDLLQPVTAGAVLGRVLVNEPSVLQASLDMIRAEMDVLRASTNLTVEQQQIDLMSRRVQLVALRGQLQQAEATLVRTAALHRQKLATDDEYEQAQSTRDSLEAQLKAQTELVARLEQGLPTPAQSSSSAIPTPADTLRATLRQKEQQLRLIEAQLGPIPLVAPIDGVVTLLYRRAGEAVSTAEPILQISAPRSERIIGFVRQPLTIEPKPGMSVEVRTRTFLRRVGESTITQVGLQFEPISPSLLTAMRLPVSTVPTEFGIRVHVAPPAGLALRPGEHVDLIIRE